MDELPCFQVDAFATRPFTGNPAAVCPLERWLDDAVMQQIAAENALSETAFFVRRADGDFDLRWFTPVSEVDLCGHATLASAHVVFTVLEPSRRVARFHSRSGPLTVERDGEALVMDFPSRPPEPAPGTLDAVAEALGARPRETWRARDLVAVFDRAEDVRALQLDPARVAALDVFAVIATAVGTGADGDVDFVSRFFAPRKGVPEDPVTGSAHCTLAPLWSARLGKTTLRARQVSRRGGELGVRLDGDRVMLTGSAVTVKTGTFHLR